MCTYVSASPLWPSQAVRHVVTNCCLQVPPALCSTICVLQFSVCSPLQSSYLLLAVRLLAIWNRYLPFRFPATLRDESFSTHRGGPHNLVPQIYLLIWSRQLSSKVQRICDEISIPPETTKSDPEVTKDLSIFFQKGVSENLELDFSINMKSNENHNIPHVFGT